MKSFLEGFMSIFDWMFPKYKNYDELSEEVDCRLQNLYDKMNWGKYENPLKKQDDLANIIKNELVEHLKIVVFPPGCDLGDIANEIGILIGKYCDDEKVGYEARNFVTGFRHGVSLAKGTHQ